MACRASHAVSATAMSEHKRRVVKVPADMAFAREKPTPFILRQKSNPVGRSWQAANV